MIKKEQMRYTINSTYYPHYLNIQRRLDRNYRKYKKTGSDKYKTKIIYYKQLVKERNKYLDSLNKTSKKIEEKTLKPYFNLINYERKNNTIHNPNIKTTIKTMLKRRVCRGNFYLPRLGLKDIIYAKRHNKTLKEVYCQKLIQKEQLHYLSKNHNQKRLERNCYKYKKNKKNRYKRRMGRRGEKFVSRMEYLDLLYNTSRAINNKSIKEFNRSESKSNKTSRRKHNKTLEKNLDGAIKEFDKQTRKKRDLSLNKV